MKVTIELTESQVRGIKKYLESTDGEKATNSDVKYHIQGIVSATLSSSSEAVSDFIAEEENFII